MGFLHLSAANGEVDRQLVGSPEGDGEAVRDVLDGPFRRDLDYGHRRLRRNGSGL